MNAQKVPMDGRARAHLEALSKKEDRSFRWFHRVCMMIPVVAIVGTIIYYSVAPAHRSLVSPWIFASVAIPLFIATVWRIGSAGTRNKIRGDLKEGKLLCVSEAPFRLWLRDDPGSISVQSIMVGGRLLTIPGELYSELPQTGSGAFSFFPRTGLCWTYNGAVVWPTDDVKVSS